MGEATEDEGAGAAVGAECGDAMPYGAKVVEVERRWGMVWMGVAVVMTVVMVAWRGYRVVDVLRILSDPGWTS